MSTGQVQQRICHATDMQQTLVVVTVRMILLEFTGTVRWHHWRMESETPIDKSSLLYADTKCSYSADRKFRQLLRWISVAILP